ncbi:MAG TPA: lipoate--protein ligase family protein, partial [Clostridia bacterium]|nr:lipoate--protein ligase family protein [Clostridia bacterium]
MKIIVQRESNDPAWNLALEQTLLETVQEDLFLLWQNGPSVIVGRNQNARAEVDESLVEALGLPVVRRMTGGGAVYHDLGNLNFSYIECRAGGHFGDFARYTKPVLEALRQLGIDAELGGRNDLLVDGRKISGNAQCLWRGRMLHHGTLLFDADLTVLGRVLRPDPAKLAGKGVASVRSRVTNLRAVCPGLTLDQLLDALCKG